MPRRMFFFLLVVAIQSFTLSGWADDSQSFLLSENGAGRATGYSETNKIVTFHGKTHVAWLDSVPAEDGSGSHFQVRIRTLDHATGQWSPTYTIGDSRDNHGGPALTIDSRGYLHVVYYPHSNPMLYRRSLRPNDASAWSPEIKFGQGLTYPALVVGPHDVLYLTARLRTEAEWGVQMFTKPANSDQWSEPVLLIKADEADYSQFQVALAWGPQHKTLHLSTRIYGDTPRWCKVLGYMKSNDFGKSWQRSDGSPIALPALADTLDAIEVADPALREVLFDTTALRCGTIAVDRHNVPYILYNTLSGDGKLPYQAWIAHPDGQGGWEKLSLNDKIEALPQGWSLSVPGGISFTPSGDMVLALSISNDQRSNATWGRETCEVVYARSSDGGQTFQSQIISTIDALTPHWLANLERPTGFNELREQPAVIYTSGQKGENNQALLSNDVIYWHEP